MSEKEGPWTMTNHGSPTTTASAAAVSAGVLSAGGGAPVTARWYRRPCPDIVPADLAGVLSAVHDSTGALSDWRLDPAKLVAANPSEVGGLRQAYQSWRGSYVTERYVGDLATVRAFLSWAQQHSDVDALRALVVPDVRIDPATCARVANQVNAAGRACRDSDEEALGIAAPSRPGLLRGFLVFDTPTVVLAAGTTQLIVDRTGLNLVQAAGGAPFPAAVLAPAPAQAWSLPLAGWKVSGSGVVALTETGEVDLGDSTAAKLLSHTAPGAAHVRSYRVPLTSVFADLLSELPAIALDAARNAKPLHVTH